MRKQILSAQAHTKSKQNEATHIDAIQQDAKRNLQTAVHKDTISTQRRKIFSRKPEGMSYVICESTRINSEQILIGKKNGK